MGKRLASTSGRKFHLKAPSREFVSMNSHWHPLGKKRAILSSRRWSRVGRGCRSAGRWKWLKPEPALREIQLKAAFLRLHRQLA